MEELYSCSVTQTLEQAPTQVTTTGNIDTNKEDANILVDEAREAIKRLPKGKTTGCDDLSAKLIKLDSEYTISPDAVLLAADDVGLVKPQQKASGKGKS